MQWAGSQEKGGVGVEVEGPLREMTRGESRAWATARRARPPYLCGTSHALLTRRRALVNFHRRNARVFSLWFLLTEKLQQVCMRLCRYEPPCRLPKEVNINSSCERFSQRLQQARSCVFIVCMECRVI